jgi:hypothetical protein
MSKENFLRLLLGAAISRAGCAPVSASFSVSPEAGSMRSTITVENRNLADINVYVVVNGARYRLGSVQPLRSQALRIPRVISLPSDIEVYASAEASVIDERQRFSSPRFSF